MREFVGCSFAIIAIPLGLACGALSIDRHAGPDPSAGVDTSGRYAIIGAPSSCCLQPEGESTEVGARLQIAACANSELQEYVFDSAGAGTYTIKNLATELCLEASGGSGDTGDIIESTCSGSSEQEFALRGTAGGKMKFVCSVNSRVLDVEGNGISAGSRVIQSADSTRPSQEFALRRIGERGEKRPDAGASNSEDDGGGIEPGPLDAGRADAGRADAGRADAGRADAGRADAGRADAGRADAGAVQDGGRADAGQPDSGSRDAGDSGADAGSSGPPPEKTVRVFYLYPSDVPFDPKYPDGIGKVMLDAQAFFKKSLGKTFALNNPITESVKGEKTRSWYENTPNGDDKYWWSVFNSSQELQRRFKLRSNDPRWVIVSEVSAEGDGAGGGAGGGWVLLPGHDADGAAGYPANTSRWVGGMVHELGHAFGLPDSTYTDGTCMSASFYEFPNCIFTQSQKDGMLRGPYGSFFQ